MNKLDLNMGKPLLARLFALRGSSPVNKISKIWNLAVLTWTYQKRLENTVELETRNDDNLIHRGPEIDKRRNCECNQLSSFENQCD